MSDYEEGMPLEDLEPLDETNREEHVQTERRTETHQEPGVVRRVESTEHVTGEPGVREVRRSESIERRPLSEPPLVERVERTERVEPTPGPLHEIRRTERVRRTGPGSVYEHVEETGELSPAAIRHYQLVRASEIIWLITWVIEGLIGLRVVLKLIAANPNAPFAEFIYNATSLFLFPFFGLTGTPAANGSILEVPSLIAMIVYALLAWALVRALWIVFEDNPRRRRR